ncbi:MAG: protein phosphatase 2C domain-containing protein [Nocardioidaceae bacterium]
MADRDPDAPEDDVPSGTPGGGAPETRHLALRYAALSDVGRVRKDNQDSGYASQHLLVIADGVGGAARGDVASSTAVQVLRRIDAPAPADPLEALAGAMHRAHDRIAELVEQDPELDGTSTTVTAGLFDGHRIGVAHVGDSRGYLLRDGTLSQLTRDHTFVQSLVDEGRITEDEARTHPHRNLILRAVDGVHDTDPDLFYIELAPHDRLLLCSDGASGVLDQQRLADILGSGSIDYAVVELVRASLEAGSSDNVTCVVADVVDLDVDDEPPPEAPVGPIMVGAAADLARRGGTSFFRGHRGGDTGEIEAVPGEDEDGTADPEELRYAPQAPRRGRWVRRLAALLVLVVVLAVAGFLGYRWSQDQYYVAEDDGSVAIFRGVQADIPGLSMNHVEEVSDLTVAALPDYPTEQVSAGISADSLFDAHAIVSRLTGLATVCPTAAAPATPTTRPAPSASPRGTAGPKASGTPTATPTPTPTPTPSASPTLAPPDCVEATP